MSSMLRFHKTTTLSSFVLLAALIVTSTFLLSHAAFSRAVEELIVHYSGQRAAFKAPSIENKFSWDAVSSAQRPFIDLELIQF